MNEPREGQDEYVLSFAALGITPESSLARVGGKGANLGELAGAGFPVPSGFCVTTRAFREFMVSDALDVLYADLDQASPEGQSGGGEAMRAHLLGLPIPPAVEEAVLSAWRELGDQHAYAVRSSATAEDLPGASFAGQQDTYLNIIGQAPLLEALRSCWASLFTDRAIIYRAINGFPHRAVELSVVVQRMVQPEAAGILFTADPIDGRRHVISIDAGFGLGEALVSGLINPDLYKVDKRTGVLLERRIGDQSLAIVSVPGGGTRREILSDERRAAQVLSDAQINELAQLGAKIEAHFGAPQDIEWCVEDGELFIVQSRPITTLFPLPRARGDDEGLRVYFSFGHAQVMTDAMAPLGRELFRRLFPIGRDAQGLSQVMVSAGSRLYIDLTDLLRLPGFRRRVPRLLSIVDAQISAAIDAVADRPALRDAPRRLGVRTILRRGPGFAAGILARMVWRLWFARTASIVARTRRALDAQFNELRARLDQTTDPRAGLVLMLEVIAGLLARTFVLVVPSVAGGGVSGMLLTKLVGERADPKDLAALGRGLHGNVTTQMDLEIGDLADLVRAAPDLAAALRANDAPTLEWLTEQPEAGPTLAALDGFLCEYGWRGASEIDVSRPRWRDDPTVVLQVIRGNLSEARGGTHRAHHQRMQQEGEAALARVTAAARWWLRPIVRRMGRVHRDLTALREHPKFQLMRHFGLVREYALALGDELVEAGALEAREDVWMLHSHELLGPATQLQAKVAARRAEHLHHARLKPPRVITSEGEIVTAELDHGDVELPPGALRGVGVSAGVAEGVVRVVLDPATTTIHAGEILVAPFTDPGWTPLFINAAALVMEVGGTMTHGSVVAREYGIPAVVCVDEATTRLRTGERVRVDGSRGIIERLDDVASDRAPPGPER